MYTVHGYGEMIADQVRMDAYAQALRQAVRPDSVVLDLGAGAGIFGLLACRFGARRVHAVEASDIIEVARQIAAANGYADRIVFVQQRSERVTLPEQVDVIVSDLRGVLPFFGAHLRAIIDARQRFLAPGGTLIGRRDTLWAAIVEAPVLYDTHFRGWEEDASDFDQRAARQIVAHSLSKGRVTSAQLFAAPCCWATLDYDTVTGPDVHAEIAWTAVRTGTAHGLLVWFDAELGEGVGFSNAPGQPELIYGSSFFPWPQPLPLQAGDVVKVAIGAHLVEDEYTWSWDSRIERSNNTPVEFRQTTLLGEAVSAQMLRRRAVQYRPALDEDGQIDHFILSAMNGRTSVGTIARRLMVRFPRRFASLPAATSRVGEISVRYTR